MILVSKKVPSVSEAEIQVTTTEFGYVIKELNSDYEFEFDSRLVTDRPDMMFLNKDQWGKPAFTWISETASCRDGYLSSRIRKRVFDGNQSCLAVIAVDEVGDSHVYVMRNAFFTNDDECVEVGTMFEPGALCAGKSSSDLMGEQIPSLDKFVKHMRLKQLATGRISETDSLAALETQVDLLTSALSAIIASIPQESRPAWWDQVEAQLLPITTFQNTPEHISKAISDAVEYKAKVRALQSAYYADLQALYGN